MDTLDSRSLRYTDCFVQKFPAKGPIKYRLTTMAGMCLPVDQDTFTIEVMQRNTPQNEGRQHNITVRREGNRLIADPNRLEIAEGDTVLWHAPDITTPGFTVRGQGRDFIFDSSEMKSEAVYTHAFGTPGIYEWIDANGRHLSGVVEVRSLDPHDKEECQKWLAALNEGVLITIRGDSAEPARIQILTGQTVFWAIEKASGITITDARLVH